MESIPHDSERYLFDFLKLIIRGSIVLFFLFLLIYPGLILLLHLTEESTIIDNYMLLGMSLSHFLVWLALLIFWGVMPVRKMLDTVSISNFVKVYAGILGSFIFLIFMGFFVD